MIEINDFEDILIDLPNRTQLLDLIQEQENDEIIREVVLCKNRGNPDESPILPLAFWKYRKPINRLIVENNLFHRLFSDDCGETKCNLSCKPKTLWREVFFHLHNSKAAGHFSNAKTNEEFRKRFYFPNFTEFFISSIKNCLFCSQLKRVPSEILKTPLQLVSSTISYPGRTLQNELVGPLMSAVHLYELTASDVFQHTCSLSLWQMSEHSQLRVNSRQFFSHIVICQKEFFLTWESPFFRIFAWINEIAWNSTRACQFKTPRNGKRCWTPS